MRGGIRSRAYDRSGEAMHAPTATGRRPIRLRRTIGLFGIPGGRPERWPILLALRTRLAPERIRDSVKRLMPQMLADLEHLIRIPSISHRGFDLGQVRRSAEATRALFAALGLEARTLEVPGCDHPAVLARAPVPPGTPTVLLYAHHDVQPPGPRELWRTEPFEPAVRDGRLYGRGASDDRAGIIMHVGALAAYGGRPPVGVTVFVEGEEEFGSPHLASYLTHFADQLRADAVVLADMANWRVGEPALTTSLRGIVNAFIDVRTLDHGVHSGKYGGPVPDALTVLARLLATLHDERGNVAVNGRATSSTSAPDLSEEELRGFVGLRPGTHLIGEGGLAERLWRRPAISVLGIDAPPTMEAPNQLVPSGRAKVSMRLAPGDDPVRAYDDLVAHLRAHTPWGAEVSITRELVGKPYDLRSDGPVYDAMRRAMHDAWGRDPVHVGGGGSIPFVADFASAFPKASLLLTGAADPGSHPHSENESVDLGDLERATIAEALFLGYLGAPD